LMILEVFSNFNDSMILYDKETAEKRKNPICSPCTQ